MTVEVEYHAQIRQITGKTSETLTLQPDVTVQQAIRMLWAKYGEELRSFLATKEGELRPSIVLVLGDRQLRWCEPTPLHDGDTLLLLSPIAGG